MTKQEYFNKIHELQVYLNPLKKLFSQLEYKERIKVKKVEKLIEILSNAHTACISYETLLKCEHALVSESALLSTSIPYDGHTIAPSRGMVMLHLTKCTIENNCFTITICCLITH